MPWCPECKAEYRDGFTICSDCQIELVAQLENEKTLQDELVFLIRATDLVHVNLIESLLSEDNIPTFNSSSTHLDVIMGNSISGIDIYVPSRLLDDAKQIIEKIAANEANKNSDQYHADKFKGRIKSRTWILLWIFYIPGIIMMILLILYVLYSLLAD